MTFMSVDDHRIIHQGLDKLIHWDSLGLKKLGEAYDGASALKMAQQSRPDLVITDIRMPGMDGLELIAALRQIPEYNPWIVILSGFEDFEYAKQAMKFSVRHYFLKPVDGEELSSALREIVGQWQEGRQRELSSRKTRELLISVLIRRMIYSDAETRPMIRESLGAEIDLSRGLRYLHLYSRSALTGGEALLTELALPLLKPGFRIYCSALNGRNFAILLDAAAFRGNGSNALKDDIRSLFLRLRQELPPGFQLIAGPVLKDIALLPDCFRCCQNHESILKGDPESGCWIMDQELPCSPRSSLSIPHDFLISKPLMEAMETRDLRLIDRQLGAMFDKIAQAGMGQQSISLWLNSLITDVARIIHELDGELEPLIRDYYQRWNSADLFRPDTLREEVRSFCINAADYIDSMKQLNRHGIIIIICEHIKNNFASPLTLRQLGERYSMNPVYLGQLFRKVTGTSFKHYLAGVRMEAARYLLESSDLLVYEIARSVGFSDCDYFSELFAQHCGMSPGQYRQSRAQDRTGFSGASR